jgi:hypothetical protein
MLMSEVGRTTEGVQAVTAALLDRAAAALLAGIQGGVAIMLATGDLS